MINRAMLYSKFIRYDILRNMITDTPSMKDMIGKPLDIFIDIQSVYKDVLAAEFMRNDIKILAVNVLNMAAHYRHFFRNLLRQNVRVFLVNSQVNLSGNICEITNSENDDMFSIVKSLCKYFPNIYYIYKKGYNASAIIFQLINTYTMIIPGHCSSLVISNDVYAYQLPTLIPICWMLRLGVKHKYIVTANNAIESYFKNTTPSTGLRQQLLPMIMAFNKCKELNLPLLFPYKTALNKVRELIDKHIILNGYNIPNSAFESNVGIMGILARWTLCDLQSQAVVYMNSIDVIDDTWKVKRKCDFSELAAILDDKFNCDPDNILNYIYLLE